MREVVYYPIEILHIWDVCCLFCRPDVLDFDALNAFLQELSRGSL
jgi:hypothetical protein